MTGPVLIHGKTLPLMRRSLSIPCYRDHLIHSFITNSKLKTKGINKIGPGTSVTQVHSCFICRMELLEWPAFLYLHTLNIQSMDEVGYSDKPFAGRPWGDLFFIKVQAIIHKMSQMQKACHDQESQNGEARGPLHYVSMALFETKAFYGFGISIKFISL